MSNGNGCYSSDSGALFDKDRRVLLAGYSLVHNGKCVVPGYVKEIGDWAFCGCSSLCKVIIPDSVTEIGDEAFSDCKALREVSIPESVVKIRDSAFNYCNNIKFYIDSNNWYYEFRDGSLIDRKTSLTVYKNRQRRSR